MAAAPAAGAAAAVSGAPNRIVWPRALPVLLLTGFFTAAVSAVPLLEFACCLWALAGGASCVVLYRWRQEQSVSTGMGARLGATAGLAGCVFFSLAFVAKLMIFGREFRDAIREAAARNPDPKAAEINQWLASAEGAAVILIIYLVAFLLAILVFSTIGGALGAALFGEKASPSSNRQV